jgi:transcriptional regulator with XRE-family HTH domain
MDSTESVTRGRERLVTMNQIVAWNLGYYRREAKMTQQEVAEPLGWTARAVSEAERSWESGRTREFDAQLLADLAIIFGVPVVAFFLPPEGAAGEGLHFADPAGDPRTMTDLMWLALHDSDDESATLTAYRRRYRAASHRYLDGHWPEEVARWFEPATDESALADRIIMIRSKAAAVRDEAAVIVRDSADALDAIADALEKRGGHA